MGLSLVLVCVTLVAVSAYPSGPPIQTHPNICQDMAPIHGFSASSLDSYFKIVTDSSCYKEDLRIKVRVQTECATPGHIEGVFIQARSNVGTVADNSPIGMFAVSDPILSTLQCSATADSVGHNDEQESAVREMTWIAPSGVTDDVVIYGTVVHEKDLFWVGLMSDPLTYNSSCVADIELEDAVCGADHMTVTILVMVAACLFYVIA